MTMIISDLPQELKQLCYQRQREQGNMTEFNGRLDVARPEGNFNWSETPEDDWWADLDSKGFVAMKDTEYYPKFGPKVKYSYPMY
jgi:hypothetical protein